MTERFVHIWVEPMDEWDADYGNPKIVADAPLGSVDQYLNIVRSQYPGYAVWADRESFE